MSRQSTAKKNPVPASQKVEHVIDLSSNEPEQKPPVVAPPTQPIIKNVTNTRVERFTEVEPPPLSLPFSESAAVTASPPSSVDRVQVMNDEAPDAISETIDVVRELLGQIENDTADFVLRIYRLPNYSEDGKIGTRGTRRQYVDQIPVTLDYVQDIKAMAGGGAYQIFLLTPKRTIKARWVEVIDGPPREDRPAVVNPLAMMPIATAAEPVNQLQQLIEFGQMWKSLRELVLETSPVAATTHVLNPTDLTVLNRTESEEPPPNRELDLVLALLNTGNDRAGLLADRILDRMFGERKRAEPSMGDLLQNLVEPFVPAIQTGLVEYFKAQAPQRAATGRAAVTPLGNAVPGQSQENPSQQNVETPAADGVVTVEDPNAPPETEEMNDEPYLDLVENLIMVMGVAVHQPQTFDGMVDQAATMVVEFQRAEPDYADWIDSLLMMAPKGVLTSMVMLIPDAAPLRSNPEAVRFVEQLQVKLKANDAIEKEKVK